MEFKICLSCLNQIKSDDKIYLNDKDTYHNNCYTQLIVNKSLKIVNQIKLMEPTDIIHNFLINDKFKISDGDKEILKEYLEKNNLAKPITFDFDSNVLAKPITFDFDSNNLAKNINQFNLQNMLDPTTINNITENMLDNMYDNMTSQPDDKFQNIFSKNEFKQLISSSMGYVMNDPEAYKEIMQSSINGSHDIYNIESYSNIKQSNSFIQKMMATWPNDLKNKIINLQSTELNKQPLNPVNLNENYDTESDSESDSESELYANTESNLIIEDID